MSQEPSDGPKPGNGNATQSNAGDPSKGSAPSASGFRGRAPIEPGGLRTALAVVVPFVLGQLFHAPVVGLMVGLGGLYSSLSDKPGATWRTLLVSALMISLSGMAGALFGAGGPWVATAAMVAVAFALNLLFTFGDLTGNIGYITTLVFAIQLGLPVPLRGGAERFLEFAAGGAWAYVLTLILWHLRGGPTPATQARAAATEPTRAVDMSIGAAARRIVHEMTPRSTVFMHALRVAIAAGIAVALYRTRAVEHGYWMILTVLVIVKPEFAATWLRTLERLIGSVVGGVIALVLALTIHDIVTMNVLLFLCAAVAFSWSQRNYGLFSVLITPYVVLMINIIAPGSAGIAFVRVADTLAGCVIGLVVSWLIRSPECTKEAV